VSLEEHSLSFILNSRFTRAMVTSLLKVHLEEVICVKPI